MRTNISLLQFLTSFIMGLYSFIMCIYFTITSFSIIQFIFMTIWNYYISTVYLVTISICDFSLYILKSNKLDRVNEIFREKLSPAFTALTYLVTFTFWVMIFPVIISEGDGNFGVSLYMNLYLHLFLTILQTIDIFISYRKQKGIVIKYDFLIGALIMGAYSILSLILVYGFDKPIYPFMNNMTWYKAIGELILFIAMIFIFYLIHVGLIKLKYKCKIFIIDNDNDTEIKNLPEEETSKEDN